MDPGRLKRREEITKALKFIQSSLAYPDPEGYQDYLTGLVCNLLEEGNALFKDTSWEEAVKVFTEGLNVSQYAASEDIHIPEVLLESLYVNRAAAYYSMQEYGRGAEDCDKALLLCRESHRALYRKALCLKQLGKYKEAYSCTTDCLLINRMDSQVNELAQDLAIHLGLKIRKPYVSAKEELVTPSVINGKTTHEQIYMDHTGNGTASQSANHPGSFSSPAQTLLTAQGGAQPAASSVPEVPDDSELIGDDLDSLLDSFSNEPEPTGIHLQAFSAPPLTSQSPLTVPSVLPEPTPQLPPAFFISTSSQLSSLGLFGSSGIMGSSLDALDDVSSSTNSCALDAPSEGLYGTITSNVGPPTTQNSLDDLDSLDTLLSTDTTIVQEASIVSTSDSDRCIVQALGLQQDLATNGVCSDTGINAVDFLDSLDSLDTFPSGGNVTATTGARLDSLSALKKNGESSFVNPAPLKTSSKNKGGNKLSPAKESKDLTLTHQFIQACSSCYLRTGKGIYSFVHKPGLVHNCERNILLCREKDSVLPWTRVRRKPVCTAFSGPFVLCREIQQSGDLGLCKYGENCTFAFNQLEIDVWTQERRGKFNRNRLFDAPAVKQDPVKGVIQILEENRGMFIFLCGACFDGKPTIISKRSKDDSTVCSNMDVRHSFDANKCLAFMMRNINVRYKKVRRLQLLCRLELCHHSIRYGCVLGDDCLFAHSEVELKTWTLMKETGTTPDEIVKVSTNHFEKLNKNVNFKQQPSIKPVGSSKSTGSKELNMRMRFVCGHCWRDGVTSDPDKALKCCSAKARHV